MKNSFIEAIHQHKLIELTFLDSILLEIGVYTLETVNLADIPAKY